jgi:DNA-binding response OmpR family regulator
LAGNRLIAESVTGLITSMGWDSELIESSSLGPSTSGDWDLIVIATTDETFPIARTCAQASRDAHQHVLVISSNADPQTIADALNSGADDYVIAPFDIDECRARMRVLVSRSDHASRPHSKLIWIEPMLRTVGIGSLHATLSTREWSLLKILIDAGQEPVAAATIEERLWGGAGRQSTLASVVSRLRTRLESHRLEGIEIVTVRGIGYAIRYQGLDTSLLQQERRPGDRS